MKLLVDMNISPELCDVLRTAGWHSIHWSALGDVAAPDTAILAHAKADGYVLVTHDLDFIISAILAATGAHAPSVVQVRFQDILSQDFLALLTDALRQFEVDLDAGALLVIDGATSRARLLPIEPRK